MAIIDLKNDYLLVELRDGPAFLVSSPEDGIALYQPVRRTNPDDEIQTRGGGGSFLTRLAGAGLLLGTLAEDVATGGVGVWNDWATITTGLMMLVGG